MSLEIRSFIKKIFVALVLMILPVQVYGISLQELGNNVNYLKIISNIDTTVYLDKSNIQSIRYEPPYYTLKYTSYIVNYKTMKIMELHQISNYDVQLSLYSLFEQTVDKYSKDEVIDFANEQKNKNPGISMRINGTKLYDFDGNLLKVNDTYIYDKSLTYGSGLYQLANKVFGVYYKGDYDTIILD